jgi:hypothetical protein
MVFVGRMGESTTVGLILYCIQLAMAGNILNTRETAVQLWKRVESTSLTAPVEKKLSTDEQHGSHR